MHSSHSFAAVGASDTEVIDRTSTAAEAPALRRLFTSLTWSFLAWVGCMLGLAYWAYASPIGQHLAALAVFILATGLFGAALFKDHLNRRARATEKLIRDLTFYKHDESRAAAERLHAATVRHVSALISQAIADIDSRTQHHIATANFESQKRIDAATEQFRAGMLALEQSLPQLLGQAQWVAYAQGIREALPEHAGPTGPQAPVRATRRVASVTGLYPVPRQPGPQPVG